PTTPPRSSTPPHAATPGPSTTSPSQPSSPPTQPARPSSTKKPPAPPSAKSPTTNRHPVHQARRPAHESPARQPAGGAFQHSDISTVNDAPLRIPTAPQHRRRPARTPPPPAP